MNIRFVEEIVSDSFGLWISALFSAVCSWNPELSFCQQKDAFFSVIEYLVANGKIKFIAPGADCYVTSDNPHPRFSIKDEECHWALDTSQIVAYLKDRWPDEVSSANEEALTVYFYKMPGIIWVDDTGVLFAS